MASYTPNKGDFVILSFDPQSGHEQKGRRPALVVSNRLFNQHTGLAQVCPITNTARRNPFHVAIPPASAMSGFIMVEQVKSVDFRSREVEFIEQAPKATLDDVLGLLDAILYQ
jgi:mRNA interferase MazF